MNMTNEFLCVILEHILMISSLSIFRKIALSWIPKDLPDEKSTFVGAVSQQTIT